MLMGTCKGGPRYRDQRDEKNAIGTAVKGSVTHSQISKSKRKCRFHGSSGVCMGSGV